VYGFLAALFSHPDEGIWGRVLEAGEQKLAIATADALRSLAARIPHPALDGELPWTELDLRFLVLDLCQPLEHLKGEYERVFCSTHSTRDCSPYELDHRDEGDEVENQAGCLADLALVYRAFGFHGDDHFPVRPDHIRFELEFMRWLLAQRRMAARLARVDRAAAAQVGRYDLAQRKFFSDHLSGWLLDLAACLRQHTGGGYCEPLGRFLAAWIPLERRALGREPLVEKSHNGRLEPVPAGA
jgi:TorA maturation chaperone TorD